MKKHLLMITISLALFLTLSLIANLTFAADDTTKANTENADVNEVSKEIIGKDDAKMVFIPADEFQMGSNDYDGAKPIHTVNLDAFYIDKYEVTNAQYKKFMDATGYKAPSYWNDSNYNAPNQPVVGVTWDDAKAYAEWAGERLPTEAEWEKSARGGLSGKNYPWGDALTHDDTNYSGVGGKDIWDGTSPVGSFAPNGYDLYDMAGNVWEWCADWYNESYDTNSPQQNPTGPSLGEWRVLRGGSWDDDNDNFLLVANRSYLNPSNDYGNVGFRCVQEAKKQSDYWSKQPAEIKPSAAADTPILAQQDEIMAGRMAGEQGIKDNNDDYTKDGMAGRMAGEQAAKTNVNGKAWMWAGCIGGLFVGVGGLVPILAAYIYKPSPPATHLVGKSPEYVAEFTDAYRTKASSIQTNQAWTGCLGAVIFWLALLSKTQ